VAAEDFVDESLVVAAAGAFDLVAEPAEDFFVETNGDASLAARRHAKFEERNERRRLEASGTKWGPPFEAQGELKRRPYTKAKADSSLRSG